MSNNEKYKKRIFCSRECQIADWCAIGIRQRHKNWCGSYEHGEENMDWEVVLVPNGGLGVRAKRLIPAEYGIFVNPVYTNSNDHPGILIETAHTIFNVLISTTKNIFRKLSRI